MNNISNEEKYNQIISTLEEFYSDYNKEAKLSLSAKMASVSSAIKNKFSEFTFVGFYVVENKNELNKKVLEVGPYVSSILAVPRIEFGKGVCGSTWEKRETMIVNNVRTCNNYIACSGDVQSEIVVPVFDEKGEEVIAVLDIDSNVLDRFDDVDRSQLEYIVNKFI